MDIITRYAEGKTDRILDLDTLKQGGVFYCK